MKIQEFRRAYKEDPKYTKALTVLSLSKNNLTELPKELFELKNLETLILRHNNFPLELDKAIEQGLGTIKSYLKKNEGEKNE